MAHLAMATPGVGAEEFPCDILGPLAYEHTLLKQSFDVQDGTVAVSDKPGLGIEIDDEMLAKYRAIS